MNLPYPALNDVPDGRPDSPTVYPRQCRDPHCKGFLPNIESWDYEVDLGHLVFFTHCKRCGALNMVY